jgi:hypothetical protein
MRSTGAVLSPMPTLYWVCAGAGLRRCCAGWRSAGLRRGWVVMPVLRPAPVRLRPASHGAKPGAIFCFRAFRLSAFCRAAFWGLLPLRSQLEPFVRTGPGSGGRRTTARWATKPPPRGPQYLIVLVGPVLGAAVEHGRNQRQSVDGQKGNHPWSAVDSFPAERCPAIMDTPSGHLGKGCGLQQPTADGSLWHTISLGSKGGRVNQSTDEPGCAPCVIDARAESPEESDRKRRLA